MLQTDDSLLLARVHGGSSSCCAAGCRILSIWYVALSRASGTRCASQGEAERETPSGGTGHF